MPLNKLQQQGLEIFTNFLQTQDERFMILTGYAGSGKSFLTSKCLEVALIADKKVCICAPTNKALSEIKKKVRSDIHSKVDFLTLTKLLGKKLSYNSKGEILFKFSKASDLPLKTYDMVFVDESSMIEDKDFFYLKKHVNTNSKVLKIIFIGDNMQLPPINSERSNALDIAQYTTTTNPDPSQVNLTTIVRGNNRELTLLYRRLRTIFGNDDNWAKYQIDPEEFKVNVKFVDQKGVFIRMIRDHYKAGENDEVKMEEILHGTKILAYHNYKVVEYNKEIRRLKAFFTIQSQEVVSPILPKYVQGDLLVFTNHFVSEQGAKFFTSMEIKIVKVEITVKNLNLRNFKVYKLSYELFDDDDDDTGFLYYIHEDDKEKLARFLIHLRVKYATMRSPNWDEYYEIFYRLSPPIDYSFSLTVHKSQGSTIPYVFVDARDIYAVCQKMYKNDEFDRHLRKTLYTAMTRAQTMLVVYM
eukprot:Pgem_evm4s20048